MVRSVSPVAVSVDPSALTMHGGWNGTNWDGAVVGQARRLPGVPRSKNALSSVAQAPAVKAWPAGEEGCDGEPAFSSCGHKKLPTVDATPRFTLSWRLRSKIKGS